MTVPKKVKKYLDDNQVNYQELAHRTVYTAYDAAQTLKKELKNIAKNLLVEVDKSYVLVVVPANKKIDLKKIKKALGAKKVSIPKENIMVKVLKVKPGAISSFGRLHKLETLVDKAMLNVRQAVFSTGSFSNSVLMKVKDFIKLEEAKLASVAMSGGYKIPRKTKRQMKQVIKTQPKKKPAKKTAGKKTVAGKRATSRKSPLKKKK